MRKIKSAKPDDYADLAGRTKFLCDWFSDRTFRSAEIVEIGSGTGWFAKFVADLPQVQSYLGLEYDQDTLNIALEQVLHSKVKFEHGTALQLPLRDDSVDVCVSFDVLEHIPSKTESQFFNEINRVLRPGGAVFISTPNHHPLSTYTDPAFYLLRHRHYSKKTLEKFAENSGLIVHESFSRGGIWELLMLYNLYFSKWVLSRDPLFYNLLARKMNKAYELNIGIMNRFLLAYKPEKVTGLP